ncbi:MAG: hypothetical protein ACP5E3_03570, partial [Bacteroidales bacterium]
MYRIVILFFTIFLLLSFASDSGDLSPIGTIKPLAERIIRESVFDFQPALEQQTHGLQKVNFNSLKTEGIEKPVAFALSYVSAISDTLQKFGISYKGKVEIFVNDNLVLKGPEKPGFVFSEYTYDRFHFDTSVYIFLNKGYNKVLIKAEPLKEQWEVLIRPIDELGNQEYNIDFNLADFAPGISGYRWLLNGPYEYKGKEESKLPPVQGIQNSYVYEDHYYNWSLPDQHVLKAFVIPEYFTYRRESYVDWHYGIGAMYMVMLELSEITGDENYLKHVKKYNDFVLENYPYFHWQYHHFNAIRGSYHRLIRAVMLDDCGAPALSMLELALNHGYDQYDSLLFE